MTPNPTGKVSRTATGRDLVLTRSFRAPIEDVWASITESERTARWFGPWSGKPGAGNTIRYAMSFEEGSPEADMLIEACEPPRHLALRGTDDYSSWFMELELSEAKGITELRFIHHLDSEVDVGAVGPGWEYYLDNLVASRNNEALPQFTDYYPSQSAYYRERDEQL